MNNIFNGNQIVQKAETLVREILDGMKDGLGVLAIIDNDPAPENQGAIHSINVTKVGDSVEIFNPLKKKDKTVKGFVNHLVKYLDRSVWPETGNSQYLVVRFTHYEFNVEMWGDNFTLGEPTDTKQWDIVGGALLEMPVSDEE